jgi:diguanylate cyclase (GGDEF)-like protein
MKRGVERGVVAHFPRSTAPDMACSDAASHHFAGNHDASHQAAWRGGASHVDYPHVICELRVRPISEGPGQPFGAIACFSDVTEAVSLRRELEHRAETDELTGCANRRSVMAFLERLVKSPGPLGHDMPAVANRGLAVIFVDLDGFKLVNDSFGHTVGDEVLVEAAARLKRAVRSCDRVGRVGGDEFLVVCPSISTMRQAARVVARLVHALAGPVVACGRPLEVRASIGLAWASRRPVDADTLVRIADAAMYRSKAAGSGPVAVEVSPDNDPLGELARGGGTPLHIASGQRLVAGGPRPVVL